MKKVIWLALFLSCLFLSFCSSAKTKILPGPAALTFPLEESWRISYEGELTGLIQKKNGSIYFSTRKGLVYCLDSKKQKFLWKIEAGHPVSAPPCLSPDRIFFFDSQNCVYGLDKQGKLLWRREIQENISNELKEDQGKIYLGTEKGTFLVLDAASGNEVWRSKANGPVVTEAIVWKDSIIFGSGDNKLYFLNQEGRITSTVPLHAPIQKNLFINENFLYFGLDDTSFHCFNLSRQKEKWKIMTGGRLVSSPVADEKQIFFLSSNNVLFCLNKKSGEILWWRAIPSRSLFRLEILQEKIIVASYSPSLVCFNRKTGEKAGEYNAGQELRSNPLWLEPYLLINLYNSEEETGVLVYLKSKSQYP